MDPISIAASACGIAALCGTVISHVSQFVTDAGQVPQTLEEFKTSISTLRTVLNSIDRVLSERPKQLPFAHKEERKHWQDVRGVLEACNKCLHRLKNELPEPPDKHKSFAQARVQLDLNLKSNVIIQIRGHISSYTQILDLSLTTMTLGTIWETRKSQEEVRLDIQKLTSEIRATNATFKRRRINLESDSCGDLTVEEMLAKRNIEAWRESAEALAATVSLYEPDQQSVADRAEAVENTTTWDGVSQQLEPPPSINGLPSLSQPGSGHEADDSSDEESVFEFKNTYCVGKDIIRFQIAANQDNVTKLLQDGLYNQAESFQKKKIELQDQLWITHKVAFLGRADEEETLADILKRQGTKESLKRSKEILQALLKQEEEESAADQDKDRRWRLCHNLGEVHLKLGHYSRTKIFAIEALGGRRALVPAQLDKVIESGHLYESACQMNGDIDEASGVRRWLRQLEAGSQSQSRELADVLRWCRDKGFDVDSTSPIFNFETTNSSGKTPLHIAVSDENLDIVEEIVNHTRNLEICDADASTALLLACSTRNYKTTSVLLKKGARVDVQDKMLNTPLHRVHSAKGGLVITKILLKYRDPTGISKAIDINAQNIYGKTPLHLACEMGNELMVDLLLEHSADINCPGPANCTPLHVAIDSRRIAVVKKLLERGADVGVRDYGGRDALMAAKGARYASPDIIRAVVEHGHQMQRLSHGRSLDSPGSPMAGAGPGAAQRRKSSATSEKELVRVDSKPGTEKDKLERSGTGLGLRLGSKKETFCSLASERTESTKSDFSTGEKGLGSFKKGLRKRKSGSG